MANSLNRKIEENEIVIVDVSCFMGFSSFEDRVFVCQGGFGLEDFTRGRMIYGFWLDGSGNDSILGYEISKQDTEEYQKEKGRFYNV